MKASELIKLIQSQMEIDGDKDIEVSSLTDKRLPYTRIHAVRYNIFGTIEIIIK